MQIDFEDILAGSIGRMVVVSLFLVSGIWIGSMIGGFGILLGEEGIDGVLDPAVVFLSPLFLINLWIVLNGFFLAGMLIWIFAADGIGYLSWGILVGVESLFVLLGFSFGYSVKFSSPANMAVAWGVWLLLLAMLETGVWLVCQWRRSIWARQLAALRAENAMIHLERDAKNHSQWSQEDGDLR
jgi:hypothetical protein